jgi:lipopolysaccharide export system permease protein
MSHKDQSWLNSGECFLASDLDFDLLRGGTKRFASTLELISTLRSAQMLQGNDLRVKIHSRILRPFIDWTVVLLGIPLVLSRPDRHMFRVAGACLLLVAGFTAIVLGLNAVGSAGYLLSPFLATWIPLVAFLPWSASQVSGACET